MNKVIRNLFFTAAVSVSGLSAVMAFPTYQDVADTDGGVATDVPVQSETERLIDKATSGYKNLKFIQYDGVTEDTLYPEAITVYEDVRAALGAPEIESSDVTRFKGILLDLSDLLRRGSVYYSNKGDMGEMTRYATAYVDLRTDPLMRDMSFGGGDADLYPSLVYCAASGAYNSGNYGKAVDYLEEYLTTGAAERREQVSLFLAQACLNAKCPERGLERVIAATEQYPANFNLLMLALQNCLECGETERMQPLLTKALAMRPDDEQLLMAQGR
ncbi:MAG: hypothetical protein K2I91_04670, partial [Muribaculaceae bacterium]|nr:hypothetical protein [Muribaculaceae bacterium]